ncbi:hypothetical protein QNK12_15525 [Neobacillus cucumis]|nr:hypothetical protein QNK12_15525 [Neobacillus cucumis]
MALPSIPHGVWLNPDKEDKQCLGTVFSNVKLKNGDMFTRPSAGGGGLGDPLKRDIQDVLEDVIDEYVSIERAEKDYGVVIKEIDRDLDQFEIDIEATNAAREFIRNNRKKWLEEDMDAVYKKYLKGEVDQLDLISRYGIILDMTTNTLLPISTAQNREMMRKRSLFYWE